MLDKYTNIPIYKKAEDIFKMVEALGSTLAEDDDYIQSCRAIMRADIMIIMAKIVGASGVGEYTICMQNAAIIRYHAMNLYVSVGGLRMHETFKDHDYIKIIRKEIDEFRELFIDWKNSFDVSNHFWDEWELFNPPNAIKPEKVEFDDNFNLDDFNAFMENFDFDDEDLEGFNEDFDDENKE